MTTSHFRFGRLICWGLLLQACLATAPTAVEAQNRITDICTVKGQERNMLRGIGVVVGLQGSNNQNPNTTNTTLTKILNQSN